MPKRKRNEVSNGSATGAALPNARTAGQRNRIDEKVFHAKKTLHKALKLAKGFERQKLGRRQKSAVKEQDERAISRIGTEIEALKNLDLDWATESHLYKTLLKDKAIGTSPGLPPEILVAQRPVPAGPLANVTARLYNSNPVKEASAEALIVIRAALGLASADAIGGKKSVQRAGKDIETSRAPPTTLLDDISDSEDNTLDRTGSMGGAGSDEDDESFAGFDDRIAGTSNDSSQEDSMSSMNRGPMRARSSGGILSSAGSDQVSSSRSPSLSASDAEQSESEPEVKPRQAASRSKTAGFLPSLTMGGYWSGSEGEEVEDVDVAPRKNRRGQRARQKIWEMKFGQKAKHLHKDSKATSLGKEDPRDKGWDLKRGAQEEDTTLSKGYRPPWVKGKPIESNGAQKVLSGGNATQLKLRPSLATELNNAAKPDHPSWEAARKAKEKSINLASFAGKKMVFD